MKRQKVYKRNNRVTSFAKFKSLSLKAFACIVVAFVGFLISPKLTDVFDSIEDALELDDRFGLTTFNISNNYKITNEDVYLKLGEYLGSNTLLIDLFEIKEKVKELNWVKGVIVERELPHTINITIEEEVPEAVFLNHNEYHLLSRTGKILDKATDSETSSYLKVEGKNANLYFMPIVTLINGFSPFQHNIEQLTYIKERRWNVKMKNGLIILLPHEKERFALEIFLDRMPSLLEKSSLYVVDLRLIPDKIFIRAQ